ncbi:MAG: class I SAM-dependent methyltransferase [Thermoplasmata archaeon]|nr:class I SAM-dependent methyltransferase [Thermoplasmata archaeon]
MQKETDPDAAWVAELAAVPMATARSAIEEAASDRSLFRHIAREHRAEGRSSYVEIDAPLELHALVRLLRPRHVVEVGVSSGVSSAYLLKALQLNRKGTLHSADLPSRPRSDSRGRGGASWSLPPGRASGWAVPLALRARWDLRLGDKALVLPLLAEELPTIELLVYDVPHDCAQSAREFRALDSIFPEGGVAIVDHGPSGGLCPGLKAWATRRRGRTTRRIGLGLFAMRSESPSFTDARKLDNVRSRPSVP